MLGLETMNDVTSARAAKPAPIPIGPEKKPLESEEPTSATNTVSSDPADCCSIAF